LLVFAIASLGGLACDGSGSSADMSAPEGSGAESSERDMAASDAKALMPANQRGPDQPPSPAMPPTSPGQLADTAAPAMLIRTGRASLEVDSLELAIAAVRDLAARAGGYVANSSIEGGDTRLRAASLELKIPAPRWSAVIEGLEPLGEVESITEETQDVGEEYVDLSARLTNARRLETRLIELLAQRTGKLEDVLMVERELARVREEIERYEGRLRFLRSRVATSTLVVYLHEAVPLVGAPGESVLADSFRQAWRNFIQFLAWIISASGILIPLGVLIIGGALLLRRFRFRTPPEKPGEK
jgi:hypothetical protein